MDWTSPAFLDAAAAWAGVPLTGEVTQPHLRPWSTVLRLPTADGPLWLKACAPGTAYEVGLLGTLAAYDAPYVLRPIALDTDRAWALLPDGGPQLRGLLDRDPDLSRWEVVLAQYAQLQRAVEGRPLPGVPDARPALVPAQLDGLLAEVAVDPALLPGLRALQPRFASWCDELAGCAVLPTLQHDDLHDGNVFVQRAVSIFHDLGDSSFAHPFGSLLVAQRNIASRWELAPGGPELRRLRDAYLEPWTDVHDRAELELLALLATRVAKVGRVRAWQRALAGVPAGNEWAEAVPGWLEELLEPDVF